MFPLEVMIAFGVAFSIIGGCIIVWIIAGVFRKAIDEEQAAFRIPEDCNDQPK